VDASVKVLYIVSSPHSGSTLLSLVLGRHPEAANLGEVSFIPKLIAMREQCTCGTLLVQCPHWGRFFDTLAEREHVDMRAAPYALNLGDAIKSEGGSGLIDHKYQTRRRLAVAKLRSAYDTLALLAAPTAAALRAITPPSIRHSIANTMTLYRTAAAAWGKTLLIDASKFPRKAPHLYLRDPAMVRILYLLRDGRGVLASRVKYMSASHAADRWRHYHARTLRLLDRWVHPAHRCVLRYEDFVANPESRVRSLCEWLGIDYSAQMLGFSEDYPEHSAGGNPARFQISGGIRPVDDRWRRVLSGEQLETFERIAGRMNRELGYE
jgi:hypothetical protein